MREIYTVACDSARPGRRRIVTAYGPLVAIERIVDGIKRSSAYKGNRVAIGQPVNGRMVGGKYCTMDTYRVSWERIHDRCGRCQGTGRLRLLAENRNGQPAGYGDMVYSGRTRTCPHCTKGVLNDR